MNDISRFRFRFNTFIKKVLGLFFLIFICSSAVSCRCESKPEPIVYNQDACHFCKMQITDYRFAGEIVTKQGKVFKFDSFSCLRSFQQQNNLEIGRIYVSDFSNKSNLIESDKAYFYLMENKRSPMGLGYIAFSQEADLDKIAKAETGRRITWQEIMNSNE